MDVDAEHALYRFFSVSGELLYIGITINIPSRFKTHAAEKEWWHEVGNIAIEKFPSRFDVLEAERRAIVAERPRWNVQHNGGPSKSRRDSGWGDSAGSSSRLRLSLACSGCGSHFSARNVGAVHVSYAEMKAYEEMDTFRKSLPIREKILSVGELDGLPRPAKWRIHCDACNPHQDEYGEFCQNCYWIGTDRFSTYRDVLDWTAHLMEKDWLEWTDWPGLLRRVNGQLAE